MQRRKERDSERVGCVKGWMRGSSFVGTGICGRERGIRRREWTCVATDGGMGGDFVGLYIILLSLPLASLASSAVEGGLGRERASS